MYCYIREYVVNKNALCRIVELYFKMKINTVADNFGSLSNIAGWKIKQYMCTYSVNLLNNRTENN